jgi:hypothetical protein
MTMHTKSRLLAPVLALALGAVACSSDSPSTDAKAGSSTLQTRPSGPVTTVANNPAAFDTPPTTAGGARKSQPYWVPVTSLTGAGNTTTKSFTIDPGAIQWRISYHCDAAPFSVVSVNAAGQESKRKLADALTCPADSEGFASDKGAQTLKVTTPGAWKIGVDQQVDVPLVEPAPAGLAAAKVIGTAKLYNVDKVGEGTAKIYDMGNGAQLIRLEDFFVTINSDLEIRLTDLSQPKSTAEVENAPYKLVAPLKATVGTMNYEVPKDIDVTKFKSIVIWCEITRNAYAAATIQQ